MDEERGRRTDGRGGASGLIIGLLAVIVILLILVLLQLGFFSGLFGGPGQLQAPQDQSKEQQAPQNRPEQQQAPQDQQPK